MTEAVDLARLQFAVTAMYHFLFVPLTLGLSFILAIMESVYVMTGKQIYKDMVRFWGKLFGINFALGVATGLTMEFQFGTNWAYYSHYVGDIFGVPLAIEGLMAFFLESTLVGLFIFGWDRLTKVQHLVVTWLVALGSNLSALWILIANGWMQNPVGAEFNYQTMRMELTSLAEVFFNPVAQVKFVHTVSAGYVTGAMFVLSISAYYLLKGRDVAFAKRSFAIAASFGLASALSVIVLGDESGYETGEVQKAKLAAIEAEWETQAPPADFTLIGFPDQEAQETHGAIKIPGVLGLIATRSLDESVIGLKELIAKNEARIRTGTEALVLLNRLRAGNATEAEKARFDTIKGDLGYGLLLKRFAPDVSKATEADIRTAALNSIPRVAPLFWTFRLMVAAGFFMLLVFILAFWHASKRTAHNRPWLLRMALFSLPLPWVACEAGWFVAEYGRQPWSIAEVLPVHLSASSLSASDVMLSLATFIAFYTLLLVAEMYLMIRFAKQGPGSLGTGRYAIESAH
ncbi:cytochrome ubiquinol oxidase subunit I [Hahella sp. SMD15-11]|uniref:Cytochrome ubiquinol oxidase subunit I n=1 Tax=Thermohahella caldifontis TaxID=3142973 RepID=A0AB39UWM7_9GAMM